MRSTLTALALALCSMGSGCYANNEQASSGIASCAGLTGPCEPDLQSVALSGCVLSGYIGLVGVGNQTFSLIMDTGSTSIGIAAKGCTNCSGISPLLSDASFNPGSSQAVVSSYGDGSGWTGSPDLTSVSLIPSVQPLNLEVAAVADQTFGKNNTGFFRSSQCSRQAETNAYQGIFGLGGSAIALPGTQSYLDVLRDSPPPTTDAFSFAPCRSGGSMWLGGYRPDTLAAAAVYTPMHTQLGYYEVNIANLLLADQPIGLQSSDLGSSVVDTGTSILLLPQGTFATLSQAIAGQAAFQHYFPATFFTDTACVVPGNKASRGALDGALPTLGVVLPTTDGGSTTVDLPATESYLTPVIAANGATCYLPAISPMDISGGPNIIWGSSAMQNHLMIFDRAEQQLGIARSTICQ